MQTKKGATPRIPIRRVPERLTRKYASLLRNAFGIVAIGSSFLSFMFIVLWIFSTRNGLGSRETGEYFNWHILLMCMSFLIFFIPAILSYDLFPFSRSTNKKIHVLLNSLGLLSALGGFWVVLDLNNYLHDESSKINNFDNIHEIFGLITLILLVLNYFGGLICYTICNVDETIRVLMKPIHKRAGLSSVLLGIGTIGMGLQWIKTSEGISDQYAATVFLALTLIGIIFSVAKFVDKVDPNDPHFGKNEEKDWDRVAEMANMVSA